MRAVLSRRQMDVTVVLENVWDPHNISAVLRSCDAVGIQDVYIISSQNKKESKLGKKSSASASKWLTIHHYYDVKECMAELRNRYSKIYCTRLAFGSKSLYEMNFNEPLALVFGNEKEGVSDECSSLSDGSFVIPQVGMIRSLNISVACAVTLYECYRQRSVRGLYDQQPEDAGWWQKLLDEWKKK